MKAVTSILIYNKCFFYYRMYWADSELYSIRSVDLNTGEVSILYQKIAEQVTFFGLSIYQVRCRKQFD